MRRATRGVPPRADGHPARASHRFDPDQHWVLPLHAGGSRPLRGDYWLIGLGIIGALSAAIFGVLDLLTIARGTPAFTTAVTHMVLNLIVVALFAVDFAVRAAQGYEDVGALPLILSVVALLLLGVSGWLGGKLAYHYGVRVADEQTQSEGFR